ncbi:MAG TPA: hypothetical protein PKN33_10205 [Phycisphaerae bacterium]|nr:hypothetical protein [Phycisphaerae bacterium]
MHRLLNHIAHDGSRQFGELWQNVLWYEVRDHVEKLTGAKLTDFVTDHVTQAWIDFAFRDHEFSINDQFGEYWFFVTDPKCPDEILLEVLDHFGQILRTIDCD